VDVLNIMNRAYSRIATLVPGKVLSKPDDETLPILRSCITSGSTAPPCCHLDFFFAVSFCGYLTIPWSRDPFLWSVVFYQSTMICERSVNGWSFEWKVAFWCVHSLSCVRRWASERLQFLQWIPRSSETGWLFYCILKLKYFQIHLKL